MSFDRYSQSLLRYPDLGFSLDLSRMDLTDEFRAGMSGKITAAFEHLKTSKPWHRNPDESVWSVTTGSHADLAR